MQSVVQHSNRSKRYSEKYASIENFFLTEKAKIHKTGQKLWNTGYGEKKAGRELTGCAEKAGRKKMGASVSGLPLCLCTALHSRRGKGRP